MDSQLIQRIFLPPPKTTNSKEALLLAIGAAVKVICFIRYRIRGLTVVLPAIASVQSIALEGLCLMTVHVFSQIVEKRNALYPRTAMRSVEWRGNVVHCIRGRQCVRWNGVETWFLVSVERCIRRAHAYSQMAQKRNGLYPRSAMLSVEWRGNVIPFIRGASPSDGKCVK